MSPAVPAPARPRAAAAGQARLLVVLAGLSAFGPLTTDVYLPGLPDMADTLGASAAGAQLTLTVCVIGLAVGQLFVGPLSDTFGRRPPLLIGLAAFVLASIACAVAPSLGVLMAGRLAQGLTGAAGIVIARAMVRDLHSGVDAGRTFSTLNAITTSGPIFAPLIGAAVLLFTDWRGLFVALAAIGVALFAAAALATEETLPPARRHAHAVGGALRNVSSLLRHRRFLAFALPGALAFGTFFSYIAASSFVYQEVFGMSPQLYSALFAVNSLALMFSNLINRRLLSYISEGQLLIAGLTGITAGSLATLAAVIAGAGAAIVLPLLFLVAGSIGFVVSNSIALAMEGERNRAGTASALFGLFQFGLGALVAPLVGIAGASAVPMGIGMAACALAALGSHFALVRPKSSPA